jgi:hypothetical protein
MCANKVFIFLVLLVTWNSCIHLEQARLFVNKLSILASSHYLVWETVVLVTCVCRECLLGPFRFTHWWKIFLGLRSTPKKHVQRMGIGQLRRISSTANTWMWIHTLDLCWALSCLSLVGFYWPYCVWSCEACMTSVFVSQWTSSSKLWSVCFAEWCYSWVLEFATQVLHRI